MGQGSPLCSVSCEGRAEEERFALRQRNTPTPGQDSQSSQLWGGRGHDAAWGQRGHTQSGQRSSCAGRGPLGAAVAVLSGSSFPRNPLGATLGIPGNTVLGATALHLETARPRAEPQPRGSQGRGTGPRPRVGPPGRPRCGAVEGPAQETPPPAVPGQTADPSVTAPCGRTPPSAFHAATALRCPPRRTGLHARHRAAPVPIKLSTPRNHRSRFSGAGSSAGRCGPMPEPPGRAAKPAVRRALLRSAPRRADCTVREGEGPGAAGPAGGGAAPEHAVRFDCSWRRRG